MTFSWKYQQKSVPVLGPRQWMSGSHRSCLHVSCSSVAHMLGVSVRVRIHHWKMKQLEVCEEYSCSPLQAWTGCFTVSIACVRVRVGVG